MSFYRRTSEFEAYLGNRDMYYAIFCLIPFFAYGLQMYFLEIFPLSLEMALLVTGWCISFVIPYTLLLSVDYLIFRIRKRFKE